ncbi:MAG TPA: YggT family protein [Candidatus Limnocylindrales bacterium]|nr:YggT family protein [Candidatus Limnocylindrales bacterium]
MATFVTYLHSFALVLIYLLIFAIFARAAASWFVRDAGSSIMRFLIDVTEPVLAPLRRFMPSAMGIDFSPMVAILVLYLLGQLLA